LMGKKEFSEEVNDLPATKNPEQRAPGCGES